MISCLETKKTIFFVINHLQKLLIIIFYSKQYRLDLNRNYFFFLWNIQILFKSLYGRPYKFWNYLVEKMLSIIEIKQMEDLHFTRSLRKLKLKIFSVTLCTVYQKLIIIGKYFKSNIVSNEYFPKLYAPSLLGIWTCYFYLLKLNTHERIFIYIH